jgi:hypothetical protein
MKFNPLMALVIVKGQKGKFSMKAESGALDAALVVDGK